MNSFIKAEWKTIVGIVVFGGVIFGWFYYQELLKLQDENVNYQFTCLHAGTGLKNFSLGTSYAANADALSGYQKTDDNLLDLVKYESQDHSTILTFRRDKLAAVEYYPQSDSDNEICRKDFAEFSKRNKPISEPIRYDERIDVSYDGLVLVQKVKASAASLNPLKNKKEEYEDIGWIILPPVPPA